MINPSSTAFGVAARRIEQRAAWLWQIAYWCSHIASPPILGVAMTMLAAAVLATTSAWLWAIGYLLLAVVAPTGYIVWLVYQGKVTDVHVPIRAERIRPLICALALALIAWLLLYLASAPRLLQGLAGVNSLQAALFLVITLRWKVSLHCATATNLAVLAVVLVNGAAAAPFVALAPLVAWSRIYLQRHTIAQAAGGALLGATTVGIGLMLLTMMTI